MIEKAILRRIEEFRQLGEKGEVVFDFRPFLDLSLKANIKTELAFCISTANSSATAGLKFQKLLEERVSVDEALKMAGVRFHNRKSEYIREAFENFELVEKALGFESEKARKILLKIKGLGMKEASHFLRNVGREDVAIVDRHVLRWLEKQGFEIPSNMTPKRYLEMEKLLRDISEERRETLAEMDLRVWAEMTGKVLK
ncbi:MAG: N-glycosylase/DNA lyase [Archaeoglobus sp.]|uniref:N-glycosylase/DNA lyase n=1 Tax=Archaeoglobus sp. TaxID=1872626 RepID=UPI001D378F7E|nr:N-glycosylase/DNA lyase [Archaeoglobus sp.]MBO8180796.1 N-glycosylase/DNA lyase [Archaeoglobus sp.]